MNFAGRSALITGGAGGLGGSTARRLVELGMGVVIGEAHDMDVFREMLELHLFGPFNVSRLCAGAFAGNNPDEDGQRGVIINTASTAAYDGQAG